jgi:hypothetical protein
MKRIALFLIIALFALTIAACGTDGAGGGSGRSDTNVNVTVYPPGTAATATTT